MDIISEMLACPVCGGELTREGGSLLCRNTGRVHTFDVAKSGYVNLLPPGRGRNAKSGDDPNMVRARREFLETGLYDPISEEAARLAAAFCPEAGDALTLVDSGCGEGHHTINIARSTRNRTGRRVAMCGFDASKSAAERASKAALAAGFAPRSGVGADFDGDVRCAFMTGNIFSLPLKSSSVCGVISMFAPVAWEENRRVLMPEGVLIVAASGREHLIELRRIIYDEVFMKDNTLPEAAEGFSLIEHTNVRKHLTLQSPKVIWDLFRMTPFSYRAPAAGVQRLSETETLEVTLETEFYVYRLEHR